MTEHATGDRLIDLAAGLMPAVERAPLLDHLRGCAACENRFRLVCAELERSRVAPASTARESFAPRVVAGIAAAILAAVLLVPLLRAPRISDPVAYWVPVEEASIDLRGAPQVGDAAVFAEAAEAYRRHDAARVVALLRDKPFPESQEPLKLAYASALLKAGDPAEALETVDSLVIITLPQPYRDRAKWLRFGALRALAREAEAMEVARELATSGGEFNQAARRIVEGK